MATTTLPKPLPAGELVKYYGSIHRYEGWIFTVVARVGGGYTIRNEAWGVRLERVSRAHLITPEEEG